MTQPPSAALALALGILVPIFATANRAEAQVEVVPLAEVELDVAAGATIDDVVWEERVVPYTGGPIRPGAQLDSSVSIWMWLGVGGFAGGYALSLWGAGEGRDYAAIPFVGPWLAAAGALGGQEWEGAGPALMVMAGLLQPAGVVFAVFGLLNPDLFLVFDAPAGQPSPFQATRMGLVPSAAGADVGASLVVEMF